MSDVVTLLVSASLRVTGVLLAAWLLPRLIRFIVRVLKNVFGGTPGTSP